MLTLEILALPRNKSCLGVPQVRACIFFARPLRVIQIVQNGTKDASEQSRGKANETEAISCWPVHSPLEPAARPPNVSDPYLSHALQQVSEIRAGLLPLSVLSRVARKAAGAVNT